MVTVSSCISEYPCSFGRKVLGEILSAPGLEVCAVRALQTAFEVEAPCSPEKVWGQVGFNGLVGAAAGVVSYGAGSWAVSNLSIPVVNGWSIKSPVLAQGINGTVGGAAGGFVGGYFMSGFDIEKAGQSALSGLISGAVVGGGFGAAGGYIYAKQNDLNPWTGDHKSFFDGTRYSEKVKAQQSQFDNHSFPNIVDNFESSGKISTKIGNDGLYYRWLEIEGSYRGNEGTFEYIKDMNGVIWHRFFNRSKKL